MKKIVKKSLLIVLLSSACAFSHAQLIKNFDHNTLREFSEDRTKGLTWFMQNVSSTTGAISFGIPTVLIIKGIVSNDKLTFKKGMYMVKTMAVSTAITFILKYTVNRKRPFEVDSLITKASSGGGPSFPSGHTSLAFATATSLSFAYPKWYVIIPSYLWAGTVAYSRMYLGVHYPTDVWVGAVVGTLSGFLSYKLNNWIYHKKNMPVIPTIY
ncbi:MAG: phosphatase PAP2 family protein [Bacteroidetes bacterium]|nr:phosphatase PAP2 family protein [Bacteroidota bacterium]MBS1930300.1 phosphatase PAP2 family protein [Bacteroidota bacterium]